MSFLRRVWRGIAHYRLTAVTTVLLVVVVFLIARTEMLYADLRRETRDRTEQLCLASADRTHATRSTFLGIFDLFTTQAAIAHRPPPNVGPLISVVDEQLPELTCPTDRGPIVVPVPVTTVP